MATDTTDRYLWRSSLTIGMVFTVGFMAWSLWWSRVVHGVTAWQTNSDIWFLSHAARFVGSGALGDVYSADPHYLALPGWAIVVAPLIRVGDHFGLTASGPFPIPQPTLWLLLGPATALTGVFVLVQGRAMAWELGIRRHLWRVQALLLVIVLLPCTLWGHGDDMLALAATLWATRLLWNQRPERAGLALAVAICMKQWSLLAVPFLLVRMPPGRRLRSGGAALLPPVALALFPLCVDWRHAHRALIDPLMDWVDRWHAPLPLLSDLGPHASSLTRLGVLALAPVLAWFTRDRLQRHDLLTLVGVAFLIRALCEPLLFPYYLAPGLAFLELRLLVAPRHRWAAILPVAGMIWALPRSVSTWWWLGELVVLCGSAAAAFGVLPDPRRRSLPREPDVAVANDDDHVLNDDEYALKGAPQLAVGH